MEVGAGTYLLCDTSKLLTMHDDVTSKVIDIRANCGLLSTSANEVFAALGRWPRSPIIGRWTGRVPRIRRCCKMKSPGDL